MKKILLVMALSILTSTAWADFSRNNNMVLDNKTKLQWQDTKAVEKGWESAIQYCEALTLADHDDWRLPNINELYSIVDKSRVMPAIDPIFQYTSLGSYYWSSTTVKNYKFVYADTIIFNDGDDGSGKKAEKVYFVRCVRDSQ